MKSRGSIAQAVRGYKSPRFRRNLCIRPRCGRVDRSCRPRPWTLQLPLAARKGIATAALAAFGRSCWCPEPEVRAQSDTNFRIEPLGPGEMNVVERSAPRAAEAAVEKPDVTAAPAAQPPARSGKLRPLLSLAPYVARYR